MILFHLPILFVLCSGGAYASATEQRLGQIAAGFVADLVLVDPAVLSRAEHLYGLLPDAVFVGGQLTVANHLKAGDGDALPELVKCNQVLPQSVVAAAQESALSDAVYLPGRGGRPLPTHHALHQLDYCVSSESIMRLPQGLKCACVLKGKYCSAEFSALH